jgi:hypothetical protein
MQMLDARELGRSKRREARGRRGPEEDLNANTRRVYGGSIMTSHAKPAKKRARNKPAVGEALIESFSEAVAWARGEIDLPVREYHPPARVARHPEIVHEVLRGS